MRISPFYSLLVAAQQFATVAGHGYVMSPRSRNEVARLDGVDGSAVIGKPTREYCSQCLATTSNVCGKSPNGADYDQWLDSTGQPMPWESQELYDIGAVVTFEFTLTAHHWGHFEIKACPDGRSSTQDCLDAHPLTFVDDLSPANMPADPDYPERGYVGAKKDVYKMRFKLPGSISGDTILLQWKYIAGNSCNPVGYANYHTGANSQSRVLTDWKPILDACPIPYSPDGVTGQPAMPEQFWNCAEVSVRAGAPTEPNPIPTPPATSPSPPPSTAGPNPNPTPPAPSPSSPPPPTPVSVIPVTPEVPTDEEGTSDAPFHHHGIK